MGDHHEAGMDQGIVDICNGDLWIIRDELVYEYSSRFAARLARLSGSGMLDSWTSAISDMNNDVRDKDTCCSKRNLLVYSYSCVMP